jgi:hypothetical protein
MADAFDNKSPALSVGVRVRVLDALNEEGVIVEDFGDVEGAVVRLGEDQSVTAKRWAIELDDGRLVCRDTANVRRVE